MDFSVIKELNRIVVRNVPALALIWYMLLTRRERGEPVPRLVPRIKDLIPAGIGFIGVSAAAFSLAALGTFSGQLPSGPAVGSPRGIVPWIVTILACASTGYMEESYFRVYLFSRLSRAGLGTAAVAAVSTLLFSLCHLYEGPWGFLNALLSGLILSAVYARTRSVHGIAWAHGAYNILVYALGR
ncbi:CPBP family intramembrane glutamic endopeptidase [Breznakiella homolactica]|uniref:CPBP family intramembrane metalloprotease n=1 Tax=Breznakiella homolactica TaxID=2798577 RepID=A0A7T7XKQ3_9SPIR|nr:CPBP family intramembrane glutamic endopeptidase [Breznakiella homolactica]QQO08033.1 CPBP family intramembrane metalloprotease [Breznakiella homolactica]